MTSLSTRLKIGCLLISVMLITKAFGCTIRHCLTDWYTCSAKDVKYIKHTIYGEDCRLDKSEKNNYKRLSEIYLNCSDNPSYTSGCYANCVSLMFARILGLKKFICYYNKG